MNAHFLFPIILGFVTLSLRSDDSFAVLDVGLAVSNRSPSDHFSQDFCNHIIETAPQKIKDVIYLLMDPECPERIRPKKLLLFGPSGSGKTTLGQVIAHQLGRSCLLINAGLLGNEYKNSAAQNLRRAVEPVLSKPCIIILDEVDSILRQSKNENNPDLDTPKQVWEILDMCEQYSNVLVICITNDIKNLPDPVQTRFAGDIIEIPLSSSYKIRKQILMIHLGDSLYHCSDAFLEALMKKTENFSYRELETLVISAASISYLRKTSPYLITEQDFNIAFARMQNNKNSLKESSWGSYEKYFQYGLQIAGLLISVATLINSWRASSEAYDQQERGFTQLAQQFYLLRKSQPKPKLKNDLWESCNQKECIGKPVLITSADQLVPGVTYHHFPVTQKNYAGKPVAITSNDQFLPGVIYSPLPSH